MAWFDDDANASPQRDQEFAADDLSSALSVQADKYAPSAEVIVALFSFVGHSMTDQTILTYRGSSCTPVLFDRTRLRGRVERLGRAIYRNGGEEAYAIRLSVNLQRDETTLDVAYSFRDAGGFVVTPVNWRERAQKFDPRGRYTGRNSWWKQQRPPPEPAALLPLSDLYVDTLQDYRYTRLVGDAEIIGIMSLDEGGAMTMLTAYRDGAYRDIAPQPSDLLWVSGYNLLDEIGPGRPAVLLTYADEDESPQYRAFSGADAFPYLPTRAGADLLAMKVRKLFVQPRYGYSSDPW